MEKVNVTYIWDDGVFDIQYTKEKEAYRFDNNYVVIYEDDSIEIEKITSEKDGKIIIDMNDNKYHSMYIHLENIEEIDIDERSVIEFIKYIIICRKNNSDS